MPSRTASESVPTYPSTSCRGDAIVAASNEGAALRPLVRTFPEQPPADRERTTDAVGILRHEILVFRRALNHVLSQIAMALHGHNLQSSNNTVEACYHSLMKQVTACLVQLHAFVQLSTSGATVV